MMYVCTMYTNNVGSYIACPIMHFSTLIVTATGRIDEMDSASSNMNYEVTFMPQQVKKKVYKTVIRPMMLHRLT